MVLGQSGWFSEETSTSMEHYYWFLVVDKRSIEFCFNIFNGAKRQSGYFKNYSLKGSLGNQNTFFFGSS